MATRGFLWRRSRSGGTCVSASSINSPSQHDGRFTPNSGPTRARLECPLSANRRQSDASIRTARFRAGAVHSIKSWVVGQFEIGLKSVGSQFTGKLNWFKLQPVNESGTVYIDRNCHRCDLRSFDLFFVSILNNFCRLSLADVRFGSKADKPSRAEINFCPLLLQ
jgi:hypothetical protein